MIDRNDALARWTTVAIAAGHHALDNSADFKLMSTKPPRQPTNNTAWGVGFIVLFILGFFTLFLAWLAIFPYLLIWAAAASTNRRSGGEQYTLTVDQNGWAVTWPPIYVDVLVDQAINQGRLTEAQADRYG